MPEKMTPYSFSTDSGLGCAESVEADKPILLFQDGDHAVYWLGIEEDSAFRCNSYLIIDGAEALLVDPGGKGAFETVHRRIGLLLPPTALTGLIVSHQDADIAASMADWLQVQPSLSVFASPRVHILLQHYLFEDYQSIDIEQQPGYFFSTGRQLHFIPAPFLHSPGTFVSFDSCSGFLFSSDIWAALDPEWQLVVDDFNAHQAKMDLFSKDFLSSNRAARGFLDKLTPYSIKAILPQHGSLIPQHLVAMAHDYLWQLECGLDLLYPEASPQLAATNGVPVFRGAVSGEAPELLEPDSQLLPEADAPGANLALTQALEQANRLAKLRDNALHSLKIVETRLAEAQAIAQLGHWEWNLETGEMSWSDEIYRIFGCQAQEFPSSYKAFIQAVHPDDRQQVKQSLRAAVEEDALYQINHQVIRPGGETRRVHEQGRVSRDQNGKPLRMVGTVHDITALTEIEEQLRSKSLLLDAIQQMQARFIANRDPFVMYRGLLDDLRKLTRSDYGLIAETETTPEGKVFLRVHAFNLPLDGPLRRIYREVKDKGFEIHEFDNLFGAVLASGAPVISNDTLNDPRSMGFSLSQEIVRSFIGIPVYFGERLVGQIGLANREGGYDPDMLEFLNPLITACGQIIVARQNELARSAAEKTLAELAKVDGLLKIPNRRSFDQYLEQQIGLMQRHRSSLALIMIDVDHFKLYNDHYGHQAGDDCLIAVARILQNSLLRPTDMVARYGGEEFCCILPETSADGALSVAEKIRADFAAAAIEHAAAPDSRLLTVSMGIASVGPDMAMSSDFLLRAADRALYAAKAAGRNCIRLAEK